jgi:hypothetical protein
MGLLKLGTHLLVGVGRPRVKFFFPGIPWIAWMSEGTDRAAKKEWKGEIPAVIAGSLRVRFLR